MPENMHLLLIIYALKLCKNMQIKLQIKYNKYNYSIVKNMPI